MHRRLRFFHAVDWEIGSPDIQGMESGDASPHSKNIKM
jgi:hypothetical protein